MKGCIHVVRMLPDQIACISIISPCSILFRWADVTVGDILIIEGECEFPADLLPLASSSQTGGCYVDTANLDGESNLKLKESVKCTQQQLRYATTDQPLLDQAVANLSSLRGQVIAEAPQKSIHSFKGRVEMDHLQEPLDAKHLLLRGTLLKNTSWILGLVVYTGAETRMVMNSRAAKAKYPNIEKVINRSMLVVVGAQCIMALISDILYLVTKERFLSLWYLFPAGQFQSILLPEFIGYWLTFFVPLDYQRHTFDFRTCRKVLRFPKFGEFRKEQYFREDSCLCWISLACWDQNV